MFLPNRFYQETAQIDLLPKDFLRKFIIICRHKNKPGLWTACVILRRIRYPILLIALPFDIHQHEIITHAVFQCLRELRQILVVFCSADSRISCKQPLHTIQAAFVIITYRYFHPVLLTIICGLTVFCGSIRSSYNILPCPDTYAAPVLSEDDQIRLPPAYSLRLRQPW